MIYGTLDADALQERCALGHRPAPFLTSCVLLCGVVWKRKKHVAATILDKNQAQQKPNDDDENYKIKILYQPPCVPDSNNSKKTCLV